MNIFRPVLNPKLLRAVGGKPALVIIFFHSLVPLPTVVSDNTIRNYVISNCEEVFECNKIPSRRKDSVSTGDRSKRYNL
jgi:hypothetical protein